MRCTNTLLDFSTSSLVLYVAWRKCQVLTSCYIILLEEQTCESCRLNQLINETLFIGGNHEYWGCFNQEANFLKLEVLNPRRDFSIKTKKINQHKTQMAITKIFCGTLEITIDVITLDIGEQKIHSFQMKHVHKSTQLKGTRKPMRMMKK